MDSINNIMNKNTIRPIAAVYSSETGYFSNSLQEARTFDNRQLSKMGVDSAKIKQLIDYQNRMTFEENILKQVLIDNAPASDDDDEIKAEKAKNIENAEIKARGAKTAFDKLYDSSSQTDKLSFKTATASTNPEPKQKVFGDLEARNAAFASNRDPGKETPNDNYVFAAIKAFSNADEQKTEQEKVKNLRSFFKITDRLESGEKSIDKYALMIAEKFIEDSGNPADLDKVLSVVNKALRRIRVKVNSSKALASTDETVIDSILKDPHVHESFDVRKVINPDNMSLVLDPFTGEKNPYDIWFFKKGSTENVPKSQSPDGMFEISFEDAQELERQGLSRGNQDYRYSLYKDILKKRLAMEDPKTGNMVQVPAAYWSLLTNPNNTALQKIKKEAGLDYIVGELEDETLPLVFRYNRANDEDSGSKPATFKTLAVGSMYNHFNTGGKALRELRKKYPELVEEVLDEDNKKVLRVKDIKSFDSPVLGKDGDEMSLHDQVADKSEPKIDSERSLSDEIYRHLKMEVRKDYWLGIIDSIKSKKGNSPDFIKNQNPDALAKKLMYSDFLLQQVDEDNDNYAKNGGDSSTNNKAVAKAVGDYIDLFQLNKIYTKDRYEEWKNDTLGSNNTTYDEYLIKNGVEEWNKITQILQKNNAYHILNDDMNKLNDFDEKEFYALYKDAMYPLMSLWLSLQKNDFDDREDLGSDIAYDTDSNIDKVVEKFKEEYEGNPLLQELNDIKDDSELSISNKGNKLSPKGPSAYNSVVKKMEDYHNNKNRNNAKRDEVIRTYFELNDDEPISKSTYDLYDRMKSDELGIK